MRINKTKKVGPVERLANIRNISKKQFEEYFSSKEQEHNNKDSNSSKNDEEKDIRQELREKVDLEKIKQHMEGKNIGHISKLIFKLEQKDEKALIADLSKQSAIRKRHIEAYEKGVQTGEER